MEPQPVASQPQPTLPPTVNSTPSVSPVVPLSKPRSRITLLIGGIVILGIGFTSGLLFNKNPYSTSQISSSPTLSVVPSPVVDPTADWKTYSSEQFGFTIRYPTEWQVQESHNPVKQAPYYGSKTSDSVKFYSDTAYVQFFTGVEFETGNPAQQRIRVEPMILSGKNLEKEIYSVSGQKTETVKIVIKLPNSTPFRVDALFQAADTNIINQILSTFTFLGQDKTTNWETYNDPNGVYQINFPNTWEIADTTSLDFYNHPTIFIRTKTPIYGKYSKLEIVIGSPIWYSTSGALCANKTCENLRPLSIQANNQTFQAELVKASIGDPLIFDYFRFRFFTGTPNQFDQYPNIMATYFNEDQLSVIKSILSTFKFTN